MTKLLLILALLCGSLLAQVQVNGPVYAPDGSLANGQMTISWQAFTASGGNYVGASSRTYRITSGVPSSTITLYSNTNSTPSGWCYVVYYKFGSVSSGPYCWTIPTSGPTTIPDVESTVMNSTAGSIAWANISGAPWTLSGSTLYTTSSAYRVGIGGAPGTYQLDVVKSGASGTARIYDQTASTGDTKIVVQNGAGQASNPITFFANNGSTVLASLTSAGLWTATNLTISGLTSAGTECLQASSVGVVSKTGSGCGGTNYWSLSTNDLTPTSASYMLGIGAAPDDYFLDVAKTSTNGTARFYDQTAVTGDTKVIFRNGAGQSSNPVTFFANNGSTVLASLSSAGLWTTTNLTISALTSAGTECLQGSSTGVVSKTGQACATLSPLFGENLFTGPVTADFTWVDQGTATATDTNNGVLMVSPLGTSVRTKLCESVAAPYTVTMAFRIWPTATNFASSTYARGSGLLLRQSSTSEEEFAWGYIGADGNTPVFNIAYCTDNTTTSCTTRNTLNSLTAPGPVYWLKVVDNSTTRVYTLSMDGVNFNVPQASSSWTVSGASYSDITPNQACFYAASSNGNYNQVAELLSWDVQ